MFAEIGIRILQMIWIHADPGPPWTHTDHQLLTLTPGEESHLNELGLDDDPGEEEAEGGHEVDEGGRGAAVVPRVPAKGQPYEIVSFRGEGGRLLKRIHTKRSEHEMCRKFEEVKRIAKFARLDPASEKIGFLSKFFMIFTYFLK